MSAVGPTLRRFVWRSHGGELTPVSNMRTSHLFYSVRMLFNHFAPPAFKIPGVKRWGSIGYAPDYLEQAVRAFAYELSLRQDLKAWQLDQLRYIALTCRDIFTRKIT